MATTFVILYSNLTITLIICHRSTVIGLFSLKIKRDTRMIKIKRGVIGGEGQVYMSVFLDSGVL